jgi:glycosyltransferase involved in cell wall biosynthesis
VKFGGAEVQTFREAALLRERGHEVMVLTFDREFGWIDEPHHKNLPVSQGAVRKAVARFGSDSSVVRRIRKVLLDFGPDVVHINNAWRFGVSTFRATVDIPALQTIRDYSAVCPRKTAVDTTGVACEGYRQNNCVSRCGLSVRTTLGRLALASYNRERAAAVNQMLAPSQALAAAATSNALPTKPLPNPFEFAALVKDGSTNGFVPPQEKRNYFYYGMVSRQKGVEHLLSAWAEFCKRHDTAQLTIAGAVDPDYESDFRLALARCSRVNFVGRLEMSDIMSLYANIYCVVVPSLWLENYPNTVLEAQANKVLAIGSDRGGIPELIRDERLRFQIASKHSMDECLEYSWNLSESTYGELVNRAFERVTTENSPDRFVDALTELMTMTIAAGAAV